MAIEKTTTQERVDTPNSEENLSVESPSSDVAPKDMTPQSEEEVAESAEEISESETGETEASESAEQSEEVSESETGETEASESAEQLEEISESAEQSEEVSVSAEQSEEIAESAEAEKAEESKEPEESEKAEESAESETAEESKEKGEKAEAGEKTEKKAKKKVDDSAPISKHTLIGQSKEELLKLFDTLLDEKPVHKLRRDIDAIKSAFYRQHRGEVDKLRRKFIDEGGTHDEFKPPVDEGEQQFKKLFAKYRQLRNEFVESREERKQDNLKKKLQVIEELKELVNSSETMHVTFNAFRELQRRWREASPVPQSEVKEVWDTYNHHVENFYSYIQINKELRDLDLKRNYETKITLCEEAEALLMDPSIVSAFHQLQKLHQEWRESGPVAKEHKEELWERFKAASQRINKKHQEFFENLKDEQERNLKLKTELCVQTEEIADGTWTTRREWNRATDKILEIQKVWRTIGFAPRKDNTKIYERFRAACDKFFDLKRQFYKELKVEMEHNLQLKTEICEAAEAVQESKDWRKTTSELIALQNRWKEIGPVSRRHSNAIWRRFRKACDHFFDRRGEFYKERDKKYEKNLELSLGLLEEINNADIKAGGFEAVKEFQRRWSEIGFVPFKKKDKIQADYKKAMDRAFDILRETGEIGSMDRFKGKVKRFQGNERRLMGERDKLFNRVKQLEADIALLENNIGFFAESKSADAMIKGIREKIELSRKEMEDAIEKIEIIDREEQ